MKTLSCLVLSLLAFENIKTTLAITLEASQHSMEDEDMSGETDTDVSDLIDSFYVNTYVSGWFNDAVNEDGEVEY